MTNPMSEKRTVEEAVDHVISSVEAFNASRSIIVFKVRGNKKKYTGPVIDQINNVIFSSNKNGVQKFLALHLLRDCLDGCAPAVIDYAANKILSNLTKLAELLSKSKDNNEKAKVLDVTEHAEHSTRFTVLLLECLREWPNMFGDANKKYKDSYDTLVKKEVQFPREKKYFSPTKEKLIADIVEIKKSILKEFSQAEEVNKEFIEAFFDEAKRTSTELQKVGMELSAAQVANSDPLIDQAFAETGPAEDIVRAFERYLKETRDYSLLKMEILGILESEKARQKKNSNEDSHEKEKGGELKAFDFGEFGDFGDFEDAGQKKDGDDGFGAFGFGKEDDDFRKGFFNGSGEKAEKKDGDIALPEAQGEDFFSESAHKISSTSHMQKSALLENERAKEEQDKASDNLEAVKRMYEYMKSQFEKMLPEQMQMSGNYGKVKEELTVLSQVHKGYGSEFNKLKNVAEGQKKIKNGLRQDAEQQLLKSQALNSEITQLKQQLANPDSRERKQVIQTKINALEKQLQSNTNFLQTLGELLKISEQEDQDNIQKISKLNEIANTKATPPKQKSPSPEKKSRELSPNKAADEVVRLEEYQNPTLISAVTLLRASRQIREQDLKAFASGQMPKVSDTPINLKISIASSLILDQENSVHSIIPTPRKSDPTPPLFNNVVRDRFFNTDVLTGRTEWKSPSTFVNPNALSGIGLSVPKFTNNYVQSLTDDQSPSSQINVPPQNLYSQLQTQAVIDNPVLKQVREFLERSKKIRFDNSIGSVFGDKLTTLTQSNVISPTLGLFNRNRASSYAQDYVPATYTPSSYNFRKEHPQGFDFGTKSLVNVTQSETPKHLKTDLFSDQSLMQFPGFIRSSDPNEEPENSLTAALERISLKSSTIHLKSSRFIKENQATKVKGQKAGRFVSYNSYLFDKLAIDIEFNRNLKDADLFRYACLASKSALLDSPILQIGLISKLNRGTSSYKEPHVSIILHYGNKTETEMSNFNINTAGVRDISVSSEVYGIQIVSKFQLKQEFTQRFVDFNLNPATIEVSFT